MDKTKYLKTKFKHYLSINPALQKTLEGKLQPKEDNYTQENRKQVILHQQKQGKYTHTTTTTRLNKVTKGSIGYNIFQVNIENKTGKTI